MTTRIGPAAAAGFLVLGILVGATGMIVVRDATTTDLADHMRNSTASTGPMVSFPGMMPMMGDGSRMNPNALMTPGDHESHHATPSPEATR
jgi:hypothetical protein